ncbi:MAG: hypothetical protein AVDCRST_MAG57-1503, partial [uncultured Blastococcus sp.]
GLRGSARHPPLAPPPGRRPAVARPHRVGTSELALRGQPAEHLPRRQRRALDRRAAPR